MDRHYRDYIVNPTFPQLAAAAALHPDFPPNLSYRPLLTKQASPGVSGNIGEALGGMIGSEVFDLPPRDIVHIIPIRGHIKAPDFIFHFAPVPVEASNFLLARGVPVAVLNAAAKWWPAEAKARKNGQARTAFKEAFGQLLAYWWELLEAGAALEDVGFGIIMIAEYQLAIPKLTVHFLIPKNPRLVQRYIRMLRATHPDRRRLGAYIRRFSARGTGGPRLARTLRLFHGQA